MKDKTISLGIVDDHKIFRTGLKQMISRIPHYHVILEAENGLELQPLLKRNLPDILLLDLKMPVMDGYETLEWLNRTFPDLPVIIISMCDTDMTIKNLVKAGARAVIRKEVEETELKRAIEEVMSYGYYVSDPTFRNSFIVMKNGNGRHPVSKPFSEREWKFLKLIGTELTYKQIADEIGISTRAVDKIREGFSKSSEKRTAQPLQYDVRRTALSKSVLTAKKRPALAER